METRFQACAASIAAAILVASAGHAQSGNPDRSTALFKEGRALAREGDFARACPKFAESLRLDPAPGTLMNLADCEEQIGRLLSARAHWNELIRTLPESGDNRRPHAQQRLEELEKRMPRLAVSIVASAPAGTRVLRDGVYMTSEQLGREDPADPGEHELVVEAPGHEERRYRVRAVLSQVTRATVEPGAKVSSEVPGRVGASSARAKALPPPAPATSSPRRTPAPEPESSGLDASDVLFLSAGAVGIVGAFLGYVAFFGSDTERREEFKVPAVLGLTGAAALAFTGLGVMVSNEPSPGSKAPSHPPAARLVPVVAPQTAGASVYWQF